MTMIMMKSMKHFIRLGQVKRGNKEWILTAKIKVSYQSMSNI